MIYLKKLLVEITDAKKANTALDYISKELVQKGPYRDKVYAAGGLVRDKILGKVAKDIDLVIDEKNGGIKFAEYATQKMGNYKEGSNPVIFPAYGTAKFELRGIIYNDIDLSDVDVECVMPRVEKYDGITRKPTVAHGTLQQDVLRRDFTVNSLLLDLTTNKILDLTGNGISDIKNGVIRTTSDNPDEIFEDDPLRMLRAIRFMVRENWNIDDETLESIKRNASKINKISSERITSELDKMLVTMKPEVALRTLQSVGLLKYIVPELEELVGLTQNTHHKDDAWEHTMEVLKNTSPVLVRRLMGLFHDIGKAATKSVSDDGNVHFYGHDKIGAEIAEKVMRRLKYPTELIKAVAIGVNNHMKLKQGGNDAVKLTDKQLRKFKDVVGEQLEDVLDLIHADNISHSEKSSMPNQIENVKKRLESLQMPKDNKIILPINGNDLIKLGFKGRAIGNALEVVKDAWFENPYITKQDALFIIKDMDKI